MPSGDVHTAVNLGVLAGTAGLLSLLGVPRDPLLLYGGGFLIGTLLITPDLDLAGHVRVRARRNWGIWGDLWRPLSLFVRHRGVTHTFLRGPALLLTYAALMLGLILTGLVLLLQAASLNLSLNLPPVPPQRALLALAGYLLAYWLHVWLDGYRPWHPGRW